MKKRENAVWLSFTLGVVSLVPAIYAAPAGRPVPMITEAVNEAKPATLAGNTRPEATAANDRGMVSDDFKLDHMLLQLQRSSEREAALKQYIEELHDANSANYHQWLTADQFAESFGVAKTDVDTVTAWLTSKGFSVNGVQASGLMIDFSGTAGQVRNAYHTEIHNLEVNGVKHFANMSDPKIPAALRPAVAGIVSLHNFHPQPQLVPRKPQYTFTNPNGTFHAVVPGDLATIYNFNPLFAAGITGAGQSITVVEDTYLFSTNDWNVFRNTFGLTTAFPYGTLSQVSPAGAVTCTNPLFQGDPSDPGYGDDSEAAVDVEYATAAAPNAAIILAACTDTETTFGGLIALENTLNGPSGSLPSVVSISYGEAEAYNGATANAAYNSAYQQAVAEGVSIFVSSGDEDAASADLANVSTHGIGISGLTSTPYNVSVGGTDFGYTADFVPDSTYWNDVTNSSTYSSALSYIQEIPWNNSCAGGLLANFLGTLGFTRTFDPLDLCNSVVGSGFLDTIGGSGGPSGCATGVPSTFGVVGGTCAGYPKPSFQSALFGNPADGLRDIPDVSLFASNGFWDAYYVVCWSDPNTDPRVGGGSTCTGPPDTWSGFGGTSVSSPIMAGIQALVNEHTGDRWGNPNTVYYSLAKTEYGGGGSKACDSTTVNKTNNPCIFYDVTQGDNDGACTDNQSVLTNCYRPAETPAITYGVLSTSNSADKPAYKTGTGWDFASGVGSVNASNLVMNWPGSNCSVSVSTGQTCIFLGGKITGNLQQNGGTLVLSGTVVTGNVQIQGGGTFSIGPGTVIDGNLQVQNLPAGTARNQVCGATVKGNLEFQNNGTAVSIGLAPSCAGNAITGNLTIQNNTASASAVGNTVGNNLTVQNNTGATIVNGNIVKGNLQDQNNTAPAQVFTNSVGGNLQCQQDSSITGGGNMAKSKQGQCAAF